MGTCSVYQPQQPSNRRYLCGIGSFDNNCAASDYEDFYYTHQREPTAGPLSHPPPATFMIGPGHPAPLPPTFQMTPQHGLVTGGTMFPQGPGGQGYVLTPPPPQAPRPPTIVQGTAPMGPPHCQLEQLPSIIPRPPGTAFVYRYY